MDSKSELLDQTFMEKQDPSKDVLMKDFRCIDSKVNSEETSTDLMNPTLCQSMFSRRNSTQLTIKDGNLGIPEQRSKITLAKSVTAVVIMIVITIFLVPIVIYHTLKSDPLPESNSVLIGDVNVSMVNYCVLVSFLCT